MLANATRCYSLLLASSKSNAISIWKDKTASVCFKNKLHTTATQELFWEKDRKGGYNTTVPDNQTTLEHCRNGLGILKTEIQLWQQEVKEKLKADPILLYRPGEVDVFWDFSGPEALEKWIVTSDSDHGQGYSKSELTISPAGKGLFHGHLNATLPKDGKVKKAGYCNIKSLNARKSFYRETYHDWSEYTHVVLRVRGDGRSYMLNIGSVGYFDNFWNDIYQFILYTRGGPYWQETKIPFSKFFLASKGKIQDKQGALCLDKVSNFGISAGDKIDGPFSLEIDYIGLECDPTHKEIFAYEMYEVARYTAAT